MERRAAHDPNTPRERRGSEWPEDTPRQRRRPRWGEFRDAYPRIVTGMALGMAALLAVDAFLLVQRWRYSRQIASLRASMSTVERERADALLAVAEGREDLEAALAAQQAIQDRQVNLAVSVEEGVMHLQREGARMRTMKVEVGPELETGAPGSGATRIVAPQGRRQVARVVGADHPWAVPAWLPARREGSVPRTLPGGLGPVAVILDDGTAIYARPEKGPLADDTYVLPGSVRARKDDLLAIRENLAPGVPVYFH